MFKEDTTKNIKNLIFSAPQKQSFNMLKRDYKSSGSKYEVMASTINFKPYVLGMKMQVLEQAKTSQMILDIDHIHFDDYELAQLVHAIL